MQKITKAVMGAAIIAVAAGVAYAATAPSRVEAQDASASWAFATPETLTDVVVAPAESLTAEVKLVGLTATQNDKSTFTTSDGESISFTEFEMQPQTGGLVEEQYIEFTVTPSREMQPMSLTFDVACMGWGDGQYAVTANGTTVAEKTGSGALGRSDKNQLARAEYTQTIALDAIEASAEPVVMRIYLFSRNNQNNRKIGVSNVLFTGRLAAVEDPKPEDPESHFALPGTLTLDAADSDIECTSPCCVEADGKIGYFKNDMTVTFKNVNCEKAGTYKVAIPADWSMGDAKFSVTVTDNATEATEATLEAVMPKNNSSFEVMEFDLNGKVTEGLKTIVFKSLENPTHENGFNWKSPEFTWTGDGGDDYSDLVAIAIPTPKDEYIDLTMGTFAGTSGNVAPNEISSTHDGTTFALKLVSEKDANYKISFATGAKGTAIIDVTLLTTTGDIMYSGKHEVLNTGSWTPSVPFEGETDLIPAGTYILKLYAHDLQGNSYAGNWGNFAVRELTNEVDEWGGPLDWEHIPGEIVIDNWTYSGARLEGGKPANNVGYVKNGCWAKVKAFCREEGVYKLNINMTGIYDGGSIQTLVTDLATGTVEADNITPVGSEAGPQDFIIEGILAKGKKEIQLNFLSNTGGFLFNYKEPVFTKIGEKFAKISSLTFEDGTPVAMEGYDWNFNLPLEYDKETVTVKIAHTCGTVTATMEGATVTDNGDGTFTIPTPARSAESVVKFVLTPEEGAASNQTEYLLRIYHIGDIILTGLDINGIVMDENTLKRFNDKEDNIKLEGYTFTAMPKVTAKFIDGSSVEATGSLNEAQTEATYTFQGKAGDFTADFKFILPGFHMYTKAENDLEYKVTFDGGAKQSDGSWNNGLFSLNPCNDGWDGTQFKLKGNSTVVLGVPGDMRIKQLRMAQLGDNYGSGRVASVTSEGATCWTPSDAFFTTGDANRYDLIINVENHTPGTPFEITFDGGSQPVTWFEFLYEEVAPEGAPTLVKSSATAVDNCNHAVVTFTFDRAMQDATIYVNGTAVKAYGGTTDLTFPVWDLPYSTNVTVTLPAGAAQDKYGNKTDDDYTVTLKVGEKAAVEAIAADRFTVVSNVTELRAAVAALSTTNNSADAAWSVIFMLDGDYDLGTDVLHLNSLYNVALIGESQDGVLLHGYKTGISDPTFSTRYSTNIYMENFTSRNDLDFGKADRAGVGVAHYGGNRDIMKNVTLQSVQDTQVTGELGYYLNVTIHGSVDYICGGGDHFYDHCDFIMEHEGGVIAAPSTSPSLKHGYVLQGCTVSGKDNFHLGRPWHGEPRTFFLNTIMKATPNPEGWRSMSELPTHFFEYNSMDADGNPLDLSTRINSPTSTNTYSPILPEEYADYFTVRNVLGGKDSWEAAEMTAACEAPVVYTDGTQLTWEAVEDAAGYLVFADGKFLAMTPDCEYALPAGRAEVVYTVAAINGNAARGTMSEAAKEAQGIIGIDTDNAAAVEYFNLQGIRVDANTTGTVIRVTRAADGSRKAEKIYKR